MTRRGLFRGGNADREPARPLRLAGLELGDATLAVLQCWEAGTEVDVAAGKRPRRAVELGVGASVDSSRLEVQPVLRLRMRLPRLPVDAVLRVWPTAEALLKVCLPVPGTGLRVAARLSLPWTEEAFDALAAGQRPRLAPLFRARLLTSAEDGRLRFSSRGVELAEQSLRLGGDTVVRAAATVELPHTFPPTEDDALRLFLDKLSLKTRLRFR